MDLMTFYLFKRVGGQEKEKSDQKQVKESPQSLIVQEGEISILNCRRREHLTTSPGTVNTLVKALYS